MEVGKEIEQFQYKYNSMDGIIISALKRFDKGNFGTKDKILFFKELSYLIQGGVSLNEAVKIIGEASESFALKEIAKNVSDFLYRGKSLSYAINRLPDYFDEGDYNIIKSGEGSGNLPIVLKSLANEYVFVSDIKNKYISALLYPIILIVIAIVAVLALFLLVLPNVFSIADSFPAAQLPWITQMLRNISTFLQFQRKLLIGIIGGLAIVLSVFFSTDAGKKTRFNILLNIPLIGKMTKYFYLVRWCRYMKLMFDAGMNYVQTFQLLRNILRIPAYQIMIENVITGLDKGETIYAGLKYETELIPSDVSVMIKVGEETANLPKCIDNVLKMYEEELNLIINRLAKVIEPIMLIFIGGIVVVIALGVFGLILQIMEGAGL